VSAVYSQHKQNEIPGKVVKMHHHKFFKLYLHDDDELALLLQSEIVERVTLHEWPLSCVQCLTLSDGSKVIYKTQFGPSVEAEFYASAQSDLLVPARVLHCADGHVSMLIDYVEAPLLDDLDLPTNTVIQIGRAVLGEIALIRGNLPTYIDIKTENKWENFIDATLKTLARLVDTQQFTSVDRPLVHNLSRWAWSQEILSALHMSPGYVHGDLSGDNLFVLAQGFRVIDWQRPRRGPTDLDLVALLVSLGIDPLDHVDKTIVWMFYLLRIHWLTQCAVQWFPDGVKGYDKNIARLASLVGKA
jgi:hypothetical protein